MKTRKFLALALGAVMAMAVTPLSSMAEGVRTVTYETKQSNRLQKAWQEIEAAEQKAIASGLDRNEVIEAVFESALNTPAVNKDSVSDFSKDGFFFTVDGMQCSYNYRLRHELKPGATPVPDSEGIVVKQGNRKVVPTRAGNTPTSPNVLLVAPYYGSDSSFTNQYKNEAQSIANTTGGTYTLLQAAQATGPNIAANYPNKGVVIYDSHGVQTGTSSYLCLTTNSGITVNDYNNGWAVASGSNAAFIDGRYIQNHVVGNLSNTFVWMAICEGMKAGGRGTTGSALLAKGAAAVYGYSQSVSFTGDYKYEATFWKEMKAGKTVAEAIKIMKDTHGLKDTLVNPYAWPVVMSPLDSFPSNPDSAQTVYCDWKLIDNNAPVALTGYSLDQSNVNMFIGETSFVNFKSVPSNANAYELVWSSSNTNVATVSGNNATATITGVGAGSATVTCRVVVNGATFGTSYISVTIREDTSLKDALNVSGGNITFTSTGDYAFKDVTESGRYIAKSGNVGVSDTTSTLSCTVNMQAGQALSFDYAVSSEANYDWFNFTVNGIQKLHLSGTTDTAWKNYTFTAPSAGSYKFEWAYTKDNVVNRGDDCVRIDNVALSGSSAPAPTPSAEPTAAPTTAPVGGTYTETSTITAGEKYIIVINGKAVGNTVYSNNHYLTAKNVTVNSDGTLTVPASVDANSILWTAGDSSYYGYSFRNVGNNKYLGLDSAQYLCPSDTSVAWKWANGDLDNQVDSEGYYYLTTSSAGTYFTTSKTTNGNVKLFKYIP